MSESGRREYKHMTTGKLAVLRQLNAEGKNDREIGEAIGMPNSTVRQWRVYLGLAATHYHAKCKPIKDKYDDVIKAMNAEGKSDNEIAETLDISSTTVRRRRKVMGLVPVGRRGPRKRRERVVYEVRKGDEVVATGNAAECAKALGLTESSFWTQFCLYKQGKYRKYEIYRVEEDLDCVI